MPAIETRGLTKRYDDVVAVEDVDLTVERGEVFGFVGPNGAGKSTTIGTVLGFRRPSDGRITVLGYDVPSEARAVRERTGLLPEGFGLYENLTGREHVVSAIRSKRADDDPDDVLDRVGLDSDDARRPAGSYSKGMTQRLALAIALVGDPELLLLDEPSSGLDPNGIERLRTIVTEEADRGATVFFSSHSLAQVARLCDRIAIMHAGRLVAVGTLAELRDRLGARLVVEAVLEDVPEEMTLVDVDGVQDVTVSGQTVRATCTDKPATIEVLDRLTETATVLDFETDERSLESLFEAYTSRRRPDGTMADRHSRGE